MKKCPFCAEEIQDEAIKCRYCNEFLDGSGPPRGQEAPTNKLPWYFRTPTIAIALLSVGPLALPMVWWHPNMKPLMKIGISVGMIILTWFLYQSTLVMIQSLEDSMKTFNTL